MEQSRKRIREIMKMKNKNLQKNKNKDSQKIDVRMTLNKCHDISRFIQ